MCKPYSAQRLPSSPGYQLNLSAKKFAHDGAGLRCRAWIAIESQCDLLAVILSGLREQ